MITGVLPCGLTEPFEAANAGSWTLAQPSGLQSMGALEASSSTALSGARGSVAVSSTEGKRIDPIAGHKGAARASSASRGARPTAASSIGARRGSASGRAEGALHPLLGADELVGAAALRFCNSYGGDAFRLLKAETMAPCLPAFFGSRWTATGDRETFAHAWRRWVEGQYPVEGTMHLPPPPRVPPVQQAAPVVVMAKAVPKAEPKPAPMKDHSLPYGSYSNIRVVLKHFRGHVATE